ncbi:biofilm formation regulator HmsP [compost metagenome]
MIAEGVETEAQREFLERNHCHAWQGYLLSPPVPVAEFEALVRRMNDGRANPGSLPGDTPGPAPAG